MSRWIHFCDLGVSASGKTRRWAVQPKAPGERPIGLIVWYGSWRKYVLGPNPGTVWEQDCLRDVAAFIEAQTHNHRATRQEVKRVC